MRRMIPELTELTEPLLRRGGPTSTQGYEARDRLVLIVDEDQDMRTILEAFLEDAGYRVVTSPDGDSALELAVRERPALVVGEHPIPLSHEETLCGALRADPATADIPFVAVTSRAMPEELADAGSMHAVVFSKPPDFAALMRMIDQLVARHPSRAGASAVSRAHPSARDQERSG